MTETPESPEPYRRATRWDIPIDDNNHPMGAGPVLLIANNLGLVLEVWTEENTPQPEPTRTVRTITSTDTIPNGYQHLASVTNGPGLVWHLYGTTEAQ